MIDTESLKKIIIDKATAGLLSSHFSGDSDVDEIIRKLPSKSNKRNKLLEQSFDYDEKYDIPLHWKWVKLGEISSYGDTPMKVMPSEMKENIWILELEDIESGGRLLTKKRYPDRKPAGEKTAFNKGQILYSKLRPYLKKVLIADEDGISTPELIAFDVFANINAKYISYCLVNSYVDRIINQRSYGVKMPRVDAGFMANLPIPLPPLEEQERIVDLVERSIIEINNISMLQQQYEVDLSVLKNKIIDAGIRGKLTEQLPEDGDAEIIYAEIKKIHPESKKNGTEIKTQAMNYTIPPNWKMVEFGEIFDFVDYRGKTPNKIDSGIFLVTASNIKKGYMEYTRKEYISEEEYSTRQSRGVTKRGDILFTTEAPMGNAALCDLDVCSCGQRVITFQPYMENSVYPLLFMYFILSTPFQKELIDNASGTTAKGIKADRLKRFLIPMPPYNEQIRIANTIDELLQIIR